MRCTSCQAENPDGAKFCGSCGKPVSRSCPKCGEPASATSRFCNQCGSSLSASEGLSGNSSTIALGTAVDAQYVPEGERKLVTALFVDIIGSTGLAQDLDPEEARAIIDPALNLMIEAVRRYEGYVVQSTGDGIFALFGAPVAREDHAQRSLYTALRMQEELRRFSDGLRATGRTPIQIRCGINSGEVVVRPIRTGETQIEYTPIGHTVNLASRLQTLANAGSTIISDTTRKLVEGYFSLRPLGETQVRGISDPIKLYEVTGLGPLRTRLEKSVGRGLSKFVGRAKEKETFRRAASLAKSGSGQIVAIVADPGVGKSRLVFEFKSECRADWNVFEAYSVSHGKGSSYLTVIQLLHSYFEFGSDDDAATRRSKVCAKLQNFDDALDNDLPYLLALLELLEDKERFKGMDSQLKRTRTLDAIVRLIVAEANRYPLILIVEDLHWLDDESQAVFDLLADALPTTRLLLLVTYRPEYRMRWGGKTWCRQLRLDSLGVQNADDMLSAILGDDPNLAPLKQLIIETTGAIPFFMEETIQVLIDEGALLHKDGGLKLVRPLAGLRIPATVQAILAARIDRLQNDEKNLLQTFSVLGREFVLSLARAVAGKSENELERLITNLQTGDFVYEQAAIADVEYTFKHALTQEVAYNSVLVERRKQLHEDVARAIESLYSTSIDDHVAELAHHYSRSGNPEKAVEYLTLSASQALSRGALSQTIRDFEAALALVKTFAPSADRDRLELQLLGPLGTAYIAARGYAAPEVGPVFHRARELCEKIGEPEQHFAVLFGNFAWRVVRGEMDLSMTLAREAMAIAERSNDPGIWMEALFLLGVTLYYRGDFSGAFAQYQTALSRFEDRERTRLWAARVGEDASVTHRCYLALTLWHLGYPEQALKVNAEMIELAREIGHPYTLAYAGHHTSWLYHCLKLPNEMLAVTDDTARISAEHGFPLFHATASIYRGAASLLQGRAGASLPSLIGGLDSYRATGSGLALPFYLSLIGEACAAESKYEEANQILSEGLSIASKTDERSQEAELQRLKGDVAGNYGPESMGAEEHYLQSLATAKRQKSRAWELRASVSLAKLYRSMERPGDAIAVLSESYNGFSEGFDFPELREAKSLLQALAT
ncbi:MAG TPA: adenylate/guanylate cyclase domain-containing protein [Methyloceanibacter sp.]